MKTISELLSRDLSRKIEEIIKVDQADEQSVYSEITEYVATDSIREQYARLFKAIAEAPSEPDESVAVWVSGFFGSGKSSFAKNLGHVLQNDRVLGQDFSTLFKRQLGDKEVNNLIDLINTRYPAEVIFFDVAKEQDSRRLTQRISEFIYTVLLRKMDYAEDFDIAELEIELEAEDKLDRFIKKCKEIYGQEWSRVRTGAQRKARASAILHALDSDTHPTADSWAQTQHPHDASITVSKVVERAFELIRRRRPGKSLVFVIDEVGQHVARSADKIEDLRAVVEEFGRISKNLMKARKIKAPCWMVVTSQEKIDEVVAAIDSKRVELAKLQDRFRHRIDLAPSDIREVATKRVLAKKTDAVPVLRKMYGENQGQLNAAMRLERTARNTNITDDDFVQFYPYPPHYIDICISIMSGIRLQAGAARQLGGSNRTIIKQAYEMLVSPRTALAKARPGTLVTLDKVYELVEGNLSNERRMDIHQISQRFETDSIKGWALRVTKVICLLELVTDLPRTEVNIAAFLVDQVGEPSPLTEVKEAIKHLNSAQFIRNTEDGWKLQTAQEKNWETERKAHDPRPRDRNDIIRASLDDIFGDSALKTYRYKDQHSFRLGVSVDDTMIGDPGDIMLSLRQAEDASELTKIVSDVREESRQKEHKDAIYWVFGLNADIDDNVAQLYASKQMVNKYDQMRSQNKITPNEIACLQDENNAVLAYKDRLRDRLVDTLANGTGMFNGVTYEAPSLGKTFSEIVKTLLEKVVPDLYPKLAMGSRPLRGDEAEILLKAADLKALPPVFYSGSNGLNLVTKEGAAFLPNADADIAKEVHGYLVSQNDYGNRDACLGKALEQKFNGTPYGWERDMLRLVLAVLFRAGVIEVTSGGQKFDSYTDPHSREPFVKNPEFKKAVFTPVKQIDLPTLRNAVLSFESLTGKTVAMDKNAIATAIKSFVDEEMEVLRPVEADVKANGMPVLTRIVEYRETLTSIRNGSAEDCVKILAGGSQSLKKDHDRLRTIADTLEQGLAILKLARLAANQIRPQLESHGNSVLAEKGKKLKDLIASEDFLDSLHSAEATAKEIIKAYSELYEKVHADRTEQYRMAIGKIKARAEWEQVPEPMREPLLSPLTSRCCEKMDITDEGLVCETCNAGISQMESDITALGGVFANVVADIQKKIAPPEVKVERVRIVQFFPETVQSPDQVKEYVAKLQDYLLDLLKRGIRIVLE